MLECVLAWICLIVAVITKEPMWAVASAAYAIALQIYSFRKECKEKEGE